MWFGVCILVGVPPHHVLRRAPLGLIALCSILLGGCHASSKQQAKAPDDYNWSDYKGTYAGGPDAPVVASTTDAPAKTSAKSSKTSKLTAAAAVPAQSKPSSDPKADLLGTSSLTPDPAPATTVTTKSTKKPAKAGRRTKTAHTKSRT